MTRTGFGKLIFSLILYNIDFENNRKTMLTEKNQSLLLSWVVSQPPPYAQKGQPAAVVTRREQQ